MKSPVDPDGLTAEWLTDTLRATGALARARITSTDIDLLGKEKGLASQIARIHLGYDTEEPAAPHSLVAKFSSPDSDSRAIIHSMGFYEREVCFYERLAGQSPLRTPRCYFSMLDPASGESLLLLEDLGSAANASWIRGCSLAEAELAIGDIAALHARWWQQPQLEEMSWLELRGLVSVHQAPAVFRQTWQPFLQKVGPCVPEEVLRAGAWLSAHLSRLAEYLYQEAPLTVVHNDYHADNLFFLTSDRPQSLAVAVADWQLVTRGRAVLDVACFLGGNLDPTTRRDHELRLLRGYHSSLINNGVSDYAFEQCWQDYRLGMFQEISRLVTVVGFGAVPAELERAYCDVLIPRYCQAARDLSTPDPSWPEEVG
jgi:hypothetical protein